METMLNKDKMKVIVNNITIIKNKKKLKIVFFNSSKKINQKIKKKSVIIFHGNQILKNFMKVFIFLLNSDIKFKKNFFLLFHEGKTSYIGHNFLPDWPGRYLDNNFLRNFFIWIKKIIYFFIFKKRLALIFIEVI